MIFSNFLQFLQFFIQALILVTYWQTPLSNYMIYVLFYSLSLFQLLGVISLLASFVSMILTRIIPKKSQDQNLSALDKVLQGIAMISSFFQIYPNLLENSSLQLTFLSLCLLTVLIANATRIFISSFQSNEISQIYIISHSLLLICSIISYILLHNYSIKSSQLESLSSDFYTTQTILNGAAAVSGIIGLIIVNYIHKNGIKQLGKIHNIFQFFLLLSMIWSLSLTYTDFSKSQSNFTNNCSANLKSLHQNSFASFGCDSKYEINQASYSAQCPTSQMTIIWEQDEGKINSEKQNQIGCLNMDCCQKINQSLGQEFFQAWLGMIFSVALMAIAMICSLFLKKAQSAYKNMIKILIGFIAIAAIFGLFYLTEPGNINTYQQNKAAIKFKSTEMLSQTSLSLQSQRMLETKKQHLNKPKFEHLQEDSTVCVKEDITLSDYTPDKEKIEICDDRAQAISLNTKYKDLQKDSKTCAASLQSCEKEKDTLQSEKAKCESSKEGEQKEAAAKAKDNYNTMLITQLGEAKKEATKECDEQISKLNKKIQKREDKIDKLQVEKEKALENLRQEYEVKIQEKDEKMEKSQSNNFVSFNQNFESLEALVKKQTKTIKELSQKNDTCEKDKLALQSAKQECQATKKAEIEKAKAEVAEKWNDKLLVKIEEAKQAANDECEIKLNVIDKKIKEKEKKIDNLQNNIKEAKGNKEEENEKAMNDLKIEYEDKLKEKEKNYQQLNDNFIVLEDLVKSQNKKIEKLMVKSQEKPEKNIAKVCDQEKQQLQDQINQLKVDLKVEKEKVKLYEDYQSSMEQIEKLIKQMKPKEKEEKAPVIIDNSKDFDKLTAKLGDIQSQISNQKNKAIKEKDEKIASLEEEISVQKEKADKCESKIQIFQEQKKEEEKEKEKKEKEEREQKEKEVKEKEEKKEEKKPEKKKEQKVVTKIVKENCDAYISQIEGLKEQLESYETTISQVTNFSKEFKEYQIKSKGDNDKNQDNQQVIVSNENDEKLVKGVDSLSIKLDNLQQAIKDNRKKIIDQQDETIKKLENKITKLSQVKQEKPKEKKESTTTINNFSNTFAKQFDTLQKTIKNNKDEIINEQNDKIKQLENKITKLTEVKQQKPEEKKQEKKDNVINNDQFFTELDNLKEAIKDNKDQIIKQQDEKIQSLENKINKLSTIKSKPQVKETIIEKDNSEEIGKLKAKLDQCKQDKNDLQITIKDTKEQLKVQEDKMEEQKDNYEKKIQEVKPVIVEEKKEQTCNYTIYEQQIATLNSQIKQYENEISTSKKDNDNGDKIVVEIKNLRNKISDLKSTIEKKEDTVESKDSEIQTLQDTIIVLQKACEKKENKKEEKVVNEKMSCDKFTKEIQELKEQITKQQDKNEKSAENKKNKNTKELLNNVDQLSIKLDSIQTQIKNSKDKGQKEKDATIEQLEEKVSQCQQKVDKCEATITANEKYEKELKDQAEEAKQKVKEIKKTKVVKCDYSPYTSQIDNLKDQIKSCQKTTTKLDEITKAIKEDKTEDQDEKILKKISALESSITVLQDNLEKSNSEANDKNDQITTLNNQLATLQADKEECQSTIEDGKDKLQTQKNKVSELKGKVDVLQQNQKDLKIQLESLQNDNTALQEEKSICEVEKSECITDKNQIITSEECEQERDQCKADNQVLISEHDQFKEQIQDLKESKEKCLTNFQNSIAQCEKDKSQIKEEIESSKDSANQEYEFKIQEQKDMFNKQNIKITELETQNDNFKANEGKLQKKLDKCITKKEDYKTQIDTLSAHNKLLEGQVKEKKEQINEMTESKDNYFDTVNSANNKIEDYLKELTKIQSKFEQCSSEKKLIVAANKTCQSEKQQLSSDLKSYQITYEKEKSSMKDTCEIDKAVAQEQSKIECPPCECECEETICPRCPDCITEEKVILQKPVEGRCPSGYNLEYKVEKVVSPDICVWPDTDFKKQLRKLGVIGDKLIKKTNEIFNIIDYSSQKAVVQAYVEIYPGKTACQEINSSPLNSKLTNSLGEATFSELKPNNYYTAQIKKEGYQVACQNFYYGNKDQVHSIALISQISVINGYAVSLEWNNPELDLQLQGAFSYSDQDTCLVGFFNTECGEMVFNTPLYTENYAAQLININQVALSKYLFFVQSLHSVNYSFILFWVKQASASKEFILASPVMKIYNSESLYPIAELVPPMTSENKKNLIWLANCIDETESQAVLKSIGQYWNSYETEEFEDFAFISLPTSEICNQIEI